MDLTAENTESAEKFLSKSTLRGLRVSVVNYPKKNLNFEVANFEVKTTGTIGTFGTTGTSLNL
jgi:hypothetical protein